MRVTRLLSVVLFASGCAFSTENPRIVPVPVHRLAPATSADPIDDYPTALALAAEVIERELALPRMQASIYLYRDQPSFEAGLLAVGYSPEFARETAKAMHAIGGSGRVLINDASFSRHSWPQRLLMLAHELTHTAQYTLASGRRSTSEHWLREGFAESVAYRVLETAGMTTSGTARQQAVRAIKGSKLQAFPPLTQMVTFPEWVQLNNAFGESSPLYAQALLATDLLIRRHGSRAIVRYFGLFARSDARLANFKEAFGTELEMFDNEFAAYLAALRK